MSRFASQWDTQNTDRSSPADTTSCRISIDKSELRWDDKAVWVQNCLKSMSICLSRKKMTSFSWQQIFQPISAVIMEEPMRKTFGKYNQLPNVKTGGKPTFDWKGLFWKCKNCEVSKFSSSTISTPKCCLETSQCQGKEACLRTASSCLDQDTVETALTWCWTVNYKSAKGPYNHPSWTRY